MFLANLWSYNTFQVHIHLNSECLISLQSFLVVFQELSRTVFSASIIQIWLTSVSAYVLTRSHTQYLQNIAFAALPSSKHVTASSTPVFKVCMQFQKQFWVHRPNTNKWHTGILGLSLETFHYLVYRLCLQYRPWQGMSVCSSTCLHSLVPAQ